MNRIAYTMLIALALCAPAPAKSQPDGQPKLMVQGEEYTSACTAANRSVRQRSLTTQFGSASAATDASTFIETLLCKKKNGGTQAFIASRMNKRVVMMTSDTGSDDLANQALVTPELVDSL